MQKVQKPRKPLIFYYLIAMLVLILLNTFFFPRVMQQEITQVSYSTFLSMLDNQEVAVAQVEEDAIYFTTKDESAGLYSTATFNDPDLVNRLYDSGCQFDEVKAPEMNPILSFLLTFILPIVVFILIGQLMSRMLMNKMGGGPMGNAMQFGKSSAKVYIASETGIQFSDVAGEDEAKENLMEIVDFLHNPGKYQEIGAKMPKGVLLVGPPGTGKTLLAKAVAGEASVPFFSISGSEFVEMFVGMGAAKVRDLFKQANEKAPCIVFIDEIDTIGKKRDTQGLTGNDEREQTLNQLLTEMDGFDGSRGVVILAATNRPETLDPALLRPGRFDRQVYVGYPDIKGREEILDIYVRNKPLAEDVSLRKIAQATHGFTGADLENLVNEAALAAARADRKFITMEDLQGSVIKVIAGPEKRSRVVPEQERKLTAYHEAGHAVVRYHRPNHDPVHQITIIPRGQTGGMTISLPTEDKGYYSKSYMEEQIVSLLGGRAAEALMLGDISTGASNDIQRATSIARSMVTVYGMSEKLGAIKYQADSDEVFIGRSMGHTRPYSEEVAAQIDVEVKAIIDEAYDRCRQILEDSREKLETVAEYLLEHETMDADVFRQTMEEAPASAPQEETDTEETQESR